MREPGGSFPAVAEAATQASRSWVSWRAEVGRPGFRARPGRNPWRAPPDMEPFRVLEHTADIGFEAFGATRQEVFANAARALTDLMVDLAAIAPRDEARFTVEGGNIQDLLVNWLSEILYRFDADGRIYSEFEIQRLDDRHLTAVARGEPFDRARHPVKLQVKAITYHQLALEPVTAGWRARVFVDI